MSGESVQVRGVETGGDPGKLVGGRPRGPDVLGLKQDLDTGRQQPRPSDRILRLVERTARRSKDIPGSGSRPARLAR